MLHNSSPLLSATRCVSDDIRSLALGLQSMLFRLFGSIPSPLIYGALFDTSCLYWQEQCGARGNCWVYDNTQLSFRLLSLPCAGMVLTSLFTLLAWKLYPAASSVANVPEVGGGTRGEMELTSSEGPSHAVGQGPGGRGDKDSP